MISVVNEGNIVGNGRASYKFALLEEVRRLQRERFLAEGDVEGLASEAMGDSWVSSKLMLAEGKN